MEGKGGARAGGGSCESKTRNDHTSLDHDKVLEIQVRTSIQSIAQNIYKRTARFTLGVAATTSYQKNKTFYGGCPGIGIAFGGGGGASLKPSDVEMKKLRNELWFLLNRPAITALLLVFHSDHFLCEVSKKDCPGALGFIHIYQVPGTQNQVRSIPIT